MRQHIKTIHDLIARAEANLPRAQQTLEHFETHFLSPIALARQPAKKNGLPFPATSELTHAYNFIDVYRAFRNILYCVQSIITEARRLLSFSLSVVEAQGWKYLPDILIFSLHSIGNWLRIPNFGVLHRLNCDSDYFDSVLRLDRSLQYLSHEYENKDMHYKHVSENYSLLKTFLMMAADYIPMTDQPLVVFSGYQAGKLFNVVFTENTNTLFLTMRKEFNQLSEALQLLFDKTQLTLFLHLREFLDNLGVIFNQCIESITIEEKSYTRVGIRIMLTCYSEIQTYRDKLLMLKQMTRSDEKLSREIAIVAEKLSHGIKTVLSHLDRLEIELQFRPGALTHPIEQLFRTFFTCFIASIVYVREEDEYAGQHFLLDVCAHNERAFELCVPLADDELIEASKNYLFSQAADIAWHDEYVSRRYDVLVMDYINQQQSDLSVLLKTQSGLIRHGNFVHDLQAKAEQWLTHDANKLKARILSDLSQEGDVNITAFINRAIQQRINPRIIQILKLYCQATYTLLLLHTLPVSVERNHMRSKIKEVLDDIDFKKSHADARRLDKLVIDHLKKPAFFKTKAQQAYFQTSRMVESLQTQHSL